MVRRARDDESWAMDNVSPTGPAPGTEQPPPAGPPPSGPRVTRDEMKDLTRLRRSVTDRHIAGVAGGIARHLDVDAIIVRVALVVTVFFGGAGLLLYVGAWVLVPEEGTQDEPLGLDQRSRRLALLGVGVLALLAALGDWAGAFWFPWPLAIIAAFVVWFLHRKQKDAPTPTSGYGSEPAYPATSWATDEAGSYASSYMPPSDPGQWQQPYARPSRPRNPRKRGPILFFFTLALIALAEGVLGVVDLAGVAVADSAYPALALALTAVMLVVGSFWGRAGGLIAVGLVAALATAGATAGHQLGDEDRFYAPTSAGEVQESYDFGGGRFTLDLSDVTDVEALDGRDIRIDGVGGRVEVVVPDGIDVDVRAQVVGGQARVFDRTSDGFDITQTGFVDGGDGVPDLSIDIDLVGGEIVVREAA